MYKNSGLPRRHLLSRCVKSPSPASLFQSSRKHHYLQETTNIPPTQTQPPIHQNLSAISQTSLQPLFHLTAVSSTSSTPFQLIAVINFNPTHLNNSILASIHITYKSSNLTSSTSNLTTHIENWSHQANSSKPVSRAWLPTQSQIPNPPPAMPTPPPYSTHLLHQQPNHPVPTTLPSWTAKSAPPTDTDRHLWSVSSHGIPLNSPLYSIDPTLGNCRHRGIAHVV
jgi:hypothetical protein